MEEEKQSKVLISIESVKLLTSSGSEGEDLLNGIEQQLNKLCIKSANLLDLDATVVHQSESTEPLISNMVFLDIFIKNEKEKICWKKAAYSAAIVQKMVRLKLKK